MERTTATSEMLKETSTFGLEKRDSMKSQARPFSEMHTRAEQLKDRQKQTITPNPLDVQVQGSHYKKMKIQPFEYSMANGLDPLQHTIIKYVSRHEDKNGREDLEKAIHCIQMLIHFKYESLVRSD